MTSSQPTMSVVENRPVGETLARRFAAVCARFGGRTAVTLGTVSWTYAELDAASDRVAGGLARRGAGPGGIVAICLERSFEMIAAMLGVVKCGAAYLPIDPGYPAARIAETIADAGPVVVVGVGGVSVAELSGEFAGAAVGDAAYVIYTSGSTGRPKGVMVSHANVLRLMDATAGWFGFGERDVWTMFHSFAFDFSVWEIWGALLTGGRLVIVPFAVSRSPEDFRALLVREKVTVLNQTPSAFALLDAVDAEAGGEGLALRVVVFGGEALALGSLRGWFGRHGDSLPAMVNMYGITETTVHVTYRRVRVADLDERESLIGVAIPDMQVWLLDEELRPVADGEDGEICVGGGGVAMGYLNRPELTAEKFVADPFRAGAKLYRSGDMGRRRADGELIYLGRRDGQVKISGYRIELGEVEAALAMCPGVKQACVVARDGRLEGFVVGRVSIGELSGFVGERLPGYMRPSVYWVVDSFPLTVNGKVDRAGLVGGPTHRREAAMNGARIFRDGRGEHPTLSDETRKDGAPARIVVETHVSDARHGAPGFVPGSEIGGGMGEHPTLSDETRKDGAPARIVVGTHVSDARHGAPGFVPGSEIGGGMGEHPTLSDEARKDGAPLAVVASAWAEVLGHSVGVDENFFDVGGTSLRLIALRAKLRERMGREIPLMWMFECTTVRAMAERLADGGAGTADKAKAADEIARRQKQAFARARNARSVSK